jgi:hypothetical protein
VCLSLRANASPGKQPQGRELKEIGGGPYKRWGVWFNSIVHGIPYQLQWGASFGINDKVGNAPQRRCMAVVSSCCETWSSVAKRTQPSRPILPFPHAWGKGRGGLARGPRLRPGFLGVAEVKSLWPISAGLHTRHKGCDRGERGPKPKPALKAATVRIAHCNSCA